MAHLPVSAVVGGFAAATLIGGSALIAQQPAGSTRSYTVKAGDTLWELARQHLSDPFLWPEIYRANSAVIADPRWLSPGRVIQLPVRTGQASASDEAGSAARAPSVPASAGAPREPRSTGLAQGGSSSRTLQMSPSEHAAGTTVFADHEHIGLAMSSLSGAIGEELPRAVRAGEYYAAPWLEKRDAPAGQGRVVASTELGGIAQAGDRGRLQSEERAYIALPRGATATRGDRFLVIARGPELADGRRVVIPTGLVQVEKTDAHDATTVRVIAHYEEVVVGQEVISAARFTMPTDVRPAPVENGAVTRIINVPARSVLPSLQHYVILEASEANGVKIGDQYTLIRPRQQTADGIALPEHRIALVQVVRVNSQGSTAIIVDQAEPVIREGVLARLSAKMP